MLPIYTHIVRTYIVKWIEFIANFFLEKVVKNLCNVYISENVI